MKRLLAVGLVITFVNASAASAAEPLLVAAVRAISVSQTVNQPKADPGLRLVSFARAAGVREAARAEQPAGAGTVFGSGMSKRTKALIYGAVAAAFVSVAYGIDHNVKDVTPSTLGTRDDDSVFGK